MQEVLRVLVVDDDPSVLEVVEVFLTARGFEVEIHESAREALAALRDNVYDLVLTDIKMAEMNGFDFLKVVRARYPAIAIIMMTGYEDEFPMSECFAAGADGYISKPFSLKKLSLLFEEGYWSAISRDDWWEEHLAALNQ